jgi:hypothetical protein
LSKGNSGARYRGSDRCRNPHADADIAAVRFVVRNLIHERELGRRLVGEGAQPWPQVALEMARRLPRHEHDTLLLLAELLAERTAVIAAREDSQLRKSKR